MFTAYAEDERKNTYQKEGQIKDWWIAGVMEFSSQRILGVHGIEVAEN